jgi:hypothetical protein
MIIIPVMMDTENVSETSDFCPELTRLFARDNCIEISHLVPFLVSKDLSVFLMVFCVPFRFVLVFMDILKPSRSNLTLREEHRLRVFENRVLRRIFGPKRDEVTG